MTTRPHLLLVDDSDAILAYERAVLGQHYTLTTASSGGEALDKLNMLTPAAVLLDLSMPGGDGEEVLARMQADPDHREIPVIIVSSERARGKACLRLGASAFIPKPLQANELLEVVGSVIEEKRKRDSEGLLAVLFVEAGGVEMAVPLTHVTMVLDELSTIRLPFGPTYLNEMFELRGKPVPVLDLARRLRKQPAAPILDRKLVVLSVESTLLAIRVDRVRDPEEVNADSMFPIEEVGGATLGELKGLCRAIVRGKRGLTLVIRPEGLVNRTLSSRLPGLLESISKGNVS